MVHEGHSLCRLRMPGPPKAAAPQVGHSTCWRTEASAGISFILCCHLVAYSLPTHTHTNSHTHRHLCECRRKGFQMEVLLNLRWSWWMRGHWQISCSSLNRLDRCRTMLCNLLCPASLWRDAAKNNTIKTKHVLNCRAVLGDVLPKDFNSHWFNRT